MQRVPALPCTRWCDGVHTLVTREGTWAIPAMTNGSGAWIEPTVLSPETGGSRSAEAFPISTVHRSVPCVGGWSQGIESKDNLPRGWWHLLSLVVQRLTGAWGFHQEMDGARRSFEVELSYELDPEARELADLISQAPSVLSLGARIQPRRQHLVERCPNPKPGFQLSAASGCHKAHPFVDAGCTGSVGQWDGRWYSHRLCDASSNCHPRETDGALVCRSSSVMQPTCIL